MRYLNKHLSCKRLKQKRKNPPGDEISAKRAWRRFNKKDTRKSCYKLQQGICAYTELSLDSELLGSHLEHIAPRCRFPERTFLSNNLILSILADDYSGTLDETERFAGHFKKSEYDDDWFISPYQKGCDEYFQYCSQTGGVYPTSTLSKSEKIQANCTISVLNLNCDYLVHKRLEQLKSLEARIETHLSEHQHMNGLSRTLQQLGEEILAPTDNRLPEFYTAKKQLFNRYKQQIG